MFYIGFYQSFVPIEVMLLVDNPQYGVFIPLEAFITNDQAVQLVAETPIMIKLYSFVPEIYCFFFPFLLVLDADTINRSYCYEAILFHGLRCYF